MRYGVFSDVQGNYKALERFFAETKGRVDQYFCLGDIVHDGTSYDDNRCIDLVLKKICLAVRGNHEDKVLADWANADKKITTPNLEYLASLSLNRSFFNYSLVHAPLDQRILTVEQAKTVFGQLPAFKDLCFFGHSHKPTVFCEDEDRKITKIALPAPGAVRLKPHSRYLINPGGVGLRWNQPQTYMIYDEDSRFLLLKKLSR